MKCRDFEILLQLSIDGEITDEEQIALELHLEGCVACRRKEAWLDLLNEHYTQTRPSPKYHAVLADAVVDALRTPQSKLLNVEISSPSPSTPPSKPQTKNRNLFSRFVSSLWSRQKRKRERNRANAQKNSGWFDASVSAICPAPLSLDGFRTAKQGVSSAVWGPVQALKLVAGAVPRKERS